MEDRYIVLCSVTFIEKTKQNTKKQETKTKTSTKHKQNTKPTKTKATRQKQHTPQSRGRDKLQFMGEKRSIKARGDSLVSSRCMHMTTCVPCRRRPMKIKQQQDTQQKHNGPIRGCGKQQSSMRKPGIPPAQDPRDHKEQPSRHDNHPDTLKQTPTKPGRNESGEKN